MISGRVQGVGYRNWAEREAIARGLHGWVRNRTNGDVEAVFKGPKEAIDGMCKACWQGPSAAKVKSVSFKPLEPDKVSELNLKEGFFQIETF
jgi:acylphosphatase